MLWHSIKWATRIHIQKKRTCLSRSFPLNWLLCVLRYRYRCRRLCHRVCCCSSFFDFLIFPYCIRRIGLYWSACQHILLHIHVHILMFLLCCVFHSKLLICFCACEWAPWVCNQFDDSNLLHQNYLSLVHLTQRRKKTHTHSNL